MLSPDEGEEARRTSGQLTDRSNIQEEEEEEKGSFDGPSQLRVEFCNGREKQGGLSETRSSGATEERLDADSRGRSPEEAAKEKEEGEEKTEELQKGVRERTGGSRQSTQGSGDIGARRSAPSDRRTRLSEKETEEDEKQLNEVQESGRADDLFRDHADKASREDTESLEAKPRKAEGEAFPPASASSPSTPRVSAADGASISGRGTGRHPSNG